MGCHVVWNTLGRSIFDHVGTRDRSEKHVAVHPLVLDVNSKISEGRKLQISCHAQSSSAQIPLAPQNIKRAASLAPSFLLVENRQGWWLGQVKAWDRDVNDQYFVRFHDDLGPSQVTLAKEFYNTDVDGVPGS